MAFATLTPATAHQAPFSPPQVLILSREERRADALDDDPAEPLARTPGDTMLVSQAGGSFSLFRFVVRCAETRRTAAVTVPYDWDAGGWMLGAARCGRALPVEQRALALALIAGESPFTD